MTKKKIVKMDRNANINIERPSPKEDKIDKTDQKWQKMVKSGLKRPKNGQKRAIIKMDRNVKK